MAEGDKNLADFLKNGGNVSSGGEGVVYIGKSGPAFEKKDVGSLAVVLEQIRTRIGEIKKDAGGSYQILLGKGARVKDGESGVLDKIIQTLENAENITSSLQDVGVMKINGIMTRLKSRCREFKTYLEVAINAMPTTNSSDHDLRVRHVQHEKSGILEDLEGVMKDLEQFKK